MGEGPLKNVKGILFGKQAQKLEDALGETGEKQETGDLGEKTRKTIETVKTGKTWLARPANCKKNHNLQLWDVLLKHHPE